MAIYKAGTNVLQGTGAAFESTNGPGTKAPWSGIYRCDNCEQEEACNKGNPLPTQNHAQHAPGKPIAWRLLVYSSG